MTLNDLGPQKGIFSIFCNFRLQRTFQEWIATKRLETNQDNLCMKFSASNVDFSSLSFDPLGSRRLVHECQRGVPLKQVVILPILARLTWKKLQIGNKHWWRAFCIITVDDLKWLWISKVQCFSVFCNFRLRCTLQEWIATKWLEIDQDNVRKKLRLSRISWAFLKLLVRYVGLRYTIRWISVL